MFEKSYSYYVARLFGWGIIAAILMPAMVHGAFEWANISPANRAECGIILNKINTPLAECANPSLLNESTPLSLEVSRSVPYQLKILSASQFGIQGHFRHLGLVGSASRFGRKGYQEQVFRLAAGRRMTDTFTLGLASEIYHLDLGDYGRKSILAWTVALRQELQPGLVWGALLRNIFGVRFTKRTPIPQIVTTGFSFKSKDLRLALEWSQDLDYPGSLRYGMDYQLFSLLNLEFGVNQRPAKISGGFSINYRGLKIEYAIDYNANMLRYTTDLGLVFTFDRPHLRANR